MLFVFAVFPTIHFNGDRSVPAPLGWLKLVALMVVKSEGFLSPQTLGGGSDAPGETTHWEWGKNEEDDEKTLSPKKGIHNVRAT